MQGDSKTTNVRERGVGMTGKVPALQMSNLSLVFGGTLSGTYIMQYFRVSSVSRRCHLDQDILAVIICCSGLRMQHKGYG